MLLVKLKKFDRYKHYNKSKKGRHGVWGLTKEHQFTILEGRKLSKGLKEED
jgi:hypothetical protein